MKLLVAFFVFGTAMCALTVALLLFPGTRADAIWRVNPEAQTSLRQIGEWAVVLMIVAAGACAAAALGLWRGTEWGRRIAIGVLTTNLIGDIAAAEVRHDPRTLIGIPIAGAMIAYLVRRGRTAPPGCE